MNVWALLHLTADLNCFMDLASKDTDIMSNRYTGNSERYLGDKRFNAIIIGRNMGNALANYPNQRRGYDLIGIFINPEL